METTPPTQTHKPKTVKSSGGWKHLIAWAVILFIFALFVAEIKSILLPFVVGILTAYFLDPLADRLQASGMPRSIATGMITVAVFLVLVLGCVLLVPVAVKQSIELLQAMPDYIRDLQMRYGMVVEEWLAQFGGMNAEPIREASDNFTGSIVKMAGDILSTMFQSGMALVNLVSLLLITPLVVFYMLRDWDELCHRIDQLLPRPHAKTIREQLSEIDRTLAGFIRGQMNVCLLLALYYGIFLSIVGLQFGFVIGLLSGLLVILPYVGFLLSFVTAMVVALIQFGFTTPFFIVFAIYMGGQVLESFFLTPKLVGDGVGLHPLWIIFGMLAGGALFGFVGVLLALPATAVMGVLIRFALRQYVHSPLYRGV